ncbi:hypothetical protein SAMN05216480_10232, partial [Pustulibacterium marinum]
AFVTVFAAFVTAFIMLTGLLFIQYVKELVVLLYSAIYEEHC